MIPIISPPTWISEFVHNFPLSHHQLKHMARYATGLIASRTKTISGMSSTFLDGLSSVSMNRFMTEYAWDSTEVNTQRLLQLQEHNETRWSKEGFTILDDTLIEKTGKHIPYAGKFYDHAKNRYAWGHNIVSIHYADRKVNYAIDYRLYKKENATAEEEFKTKIQFAKQLIQYGISVGNPSENYLFDSWYTCKDLIGFIESLNKHWIGAMKSNRLVRGSSDQFVSVADYHASLPDGKFREHEVNGRRLLLFSKVLYFKSLEQKSRLVISIDGDDVLYLVTNRRDHTWKVVRDYMERHRIEDFYKDAKQHLGLGKCQMRNIEGIKRHWYLVFLAHSILRLGVAESVLGRVVVSSAKSIGKRAKGACIELLEKFVYWLMEGGGRMEEAMDMLVGKLINR
jgi:hypothetical protein